MSHNLTILGNIVGALIGAYGINTALLMLLWALVGERWAIVGAFNSFAHLLWMGAIVLLPLALFLAWGEPSLRWVSAVALLPAVIAFMLNYAPRFLPREAHIPTPDSIILRVYTHNIAPRTSNYGGIDALIATTNADIIALQEVGHETVAHLEERWRDDYPHMALYAGEPAPHPGQGILSRYPILESRYWQFDWLPIKLGYQRVVLDVNGHRVVVYNAHPTHPGIGNFYNASYRAREIEALLGIMADETLPVILLGDFNLHDTSNDYARLNERFTDVYREVGWGMGFTFPMVSDNPASHIGRLNGFIRPMLRLDYIFTDAHFTPLSAHVLPTAGGSDHLPVIAELAFRPPS